MHTGFRAAALAALLAAACSGGSKGAEVDASRSSLDASPQSALADGASAVTLTATARDAGGTPLSGKQAVFVVSGGDNHLSAEAAPTDAAGEAAITLTSTRAEQKTVRVTIDGVAVAQAATVTFTAGPPSAARSSLVASPAAVPADGTPVTLTATIRDASGNPIEGATVVLSSSGAATLVQPGSATGADGVTAGSASASVVGGQTLTARVDAVAVASTAVAFTGGPSAATSTVEVSPASVPADGTTPAVVTVTVHDSAGQALSGQAVSLAYSGTAAIVPASATTDGSGVATFEARASAATSGNLIATVNPGTGEVVLGPSPALEFRPPGPFAIGGTVVGLTGAGLVLASPGEPDLTVVAGATAFAFATWLPSGSTYAVTVKAQPAGQACAALNGTGTVASTDVASVEVTCSNAGAGGLDGSFATGGVALTPVTLVGNASARDVAVQSDGKIVAVGEISNGIETDFGVVRFATNGSLDASFGSGGVVTTQFGAYPANESASAVAIQADGKIVVAGTYASVTFVLARYTASGVLDATFGTGGKVLSYPWPGSFVDARAVAIQPDGKIVVAGVADTSNTWDDFALARYNANGSLDTTFGSGGKVITAVASFANGSSGSSADDGATALAIQPDGKIVAAGYAHGYGIFHSDDRFAIVRYTSAGALDANFDGDGIVITPVGIGTCAAAAVAIQGDGKIVVGGSASASASEVDFALVRYAPDGTLDTTFGGTGKVTAPVGAGVADLRIQADGAIVAAGRAGNGANFDAALARYASDGSLDPTFGTGGTATLAVGSGDDTLTGVALAAGGKIVGVGYFSTGPENDWFAVRLDAAGAPDATFDGDGIATVVLGRGNDQGYAVAVQADQKIVVASASGPSQYLVDFALARYGTDGVLDAGFGAGGLVQTAVSAGEDRAHATAIQPDGKILAAGFARVASGTNFAVVRYEADGSLDATFAANGIALIPIGLSNDVARAVARQPDGKIVVAGQAYDGAKDAIAVARLTASGALDATFGAGGKVVTALGTTYDRAHAVAIQPDGKIVVAGVSSSGYPFAAALVRYTADGALDATFGTGGKVVTALTGSNNHFTALALQPDGKIVAAGQGYVNSWSDFVLARYTADGTLDPTFGTGGKVVTALGFENDAVQGIAVQPDGKIVAAGYTTSPNASIDAALVRYTPAGRLDTTFGTGGKVTVATGAATNDIFYAVALQGNGGILAAGTSGEDLLVARFLP